MLSCKVWERWNLASLTWQEGFENTAQGDRAGSLIQLVSLLNWSPQLNMSPRLVDWICIVFWTWLFAWICILNWTHLLNWAYLLSWICAFSPACWLNGSLKRVFFPVILPKEFDKAHQFFISLVCIDKPTSMLYWMNIMPHLLSGIVFYVVNPNT